MLVILQVLRLVLLLNFQSHSASAAAAASVASETTTIGAWAQGESHVGRRVVVVGASYGIGRATADLLSDRGACVVYASRNSSSTTTTTTTLTSRGGRYLLDEAVAGRKGCHAVVMDASNETSIRLGMAKAAYLLGGGGDDDAGGIDCVVYCPGYFGEDSYGLLEHLFDSNQFDAGFANSMQVHLKGMLSCFKNSRQHLLLPGRERGRSCFIALISIAGSMGHPGAALYAIAKAAVDMAVIQLALEYAPAGLRVLSIAPGLIDTPAIDNVGNVAGGGPDDNDNNNTNNNTKAMFLQELGATHAMQRHGNASEVAEVIAFLCSERASFMTGNAPLYVDGGCMLRSSLGDALRSFTVNGRRT
jgi:NAD(P)-dependent dehydrogenase (short-subunit alcohol dehydrogenase family)